MRNKNFIITIITLIFIMISCKSSEVSNSNSKNTTFMKTGYAQDGKIYSCAVFNKINTVSVISGKSKSESEIPSNMFKYNPKTTEVTISPDFPLPKGDLSFNIVGLPATPPKFVLNNIDGEPLILLEERVAKKNIDYNFISETNTLEFIVNLNIDKDSYIISCINKDGSTQTIGNAVEAFQDFYNSEIKRFLKSR